MPNGYDAAAGIPPRHETGGLPACPDSRKSGACGGTHITKGKVASSSSHRKRRRDGLPAESLKALAAQTCSVFAGYPHAS